MSDFVYDVRWTNELDEKFISDFLQVKKQIFKTGSRNDFRRQYEENIYGPSVLVVVYSGYEPVAVRGLWRNDIIGNKSYQLGSNCVLPSYRRMGIFTQMTKRAIQKLSDGDVVYTFPNENSYPGYVKMRWNLQGDYRLRIYTSYKKYLAEHPLKIDYEYAKWWLVGRPITYACVMGHYFLIQKNPRPFCYSILGEVDSQTAFLFPRTRFAFLFYKSAKTSWYNKSFIPIHVVSNNINVIYIPTWKIDAV